MVRRILILSYFFPPCNLTAAQRAYSWARYLKPLGYFPVIITRRWDVEVEKLQSLSEATRPELLHEVHAEYEVFFLPYKPNLRDRLYAKYGDKKYKLLRKFLSLWEILAQNLTNRFIPFRNMYQFSKMYLHQHTDIAAILITGNPFILFKFGYLLHQKFRIPWIADYRDEWTTSHINRINRSAISELINRWEQFFEKKWSRTASAVTSVSSPLLKHIAVIAKAKTYEVVENGFFSEEMPAAGAASTSSPFTITYVGTLFPGQQLELFARAFRRFVQDKRIGEVMLQFLGVGFVEAQVSRIQSAYKGLDPFIKITARIPRAEVLQKESSSHVLLHFAWKDFSGIVGSKLYEYIGMGKPVLVCPTDGDIVERMMSTYNLATLCHNEDDAFYRLETLFAMHKEGRYHELIADGSFQSAFTRLGQTKKLAALIDLILERKL